MGIHASQILTNMTTIVGLSGDSYNDSMNLLAASPLSVRYRDGATAKSLVIPDITSIYENPLDEWTSVLGGSTDELLIIGSINEAEYIASCNPNLINRIGTQSFYATAGSIATQYFSTSDTLVLAYAHPNPSKYSNTVVLFSDANTLLAPSYSEHSITTPSSTTETDFYLPREGGGIVAQVTAASTYLDYLICQLGFQESGESYGLDYPWYGDYRMAFPFFGKSGDWRFNLIDTYPDWRTGYYTLRVWTLPKVEYSFTIAENETCEIDLQLSVSNTSQSVGLYVLDPDGNLILDANRFALMRDDFNETSVSVTLSYPRPGNYTAYVTTPELFGANYTLDITKHTVNLELLDTGLCASNGLAIASMYDAGLILSDGDSQISDAIDAIEQIEPEKLIIVDLESHFSPSFISLLNGYVSDINHITDTKALPMLISSLLVDFEAHSSATLYDPVGEYFVAAGLSAASRGGFALPNGYASAQFTTYSQVAEQMAYHADYSVPFLGGYHYYDIWTSSPSLSELHPSYNSMSQISDSFFGWLENITGIDRTETLIIISPYEKLGTTLPPSFDRAVMGKTLVGRYPSKSEFSTYIQIAQSSLRIPLLASKTPDISVLGSHVAYNYETPVPTNDHRDMIFDTSGDFSLVINQTRLTYSQQAGPNATSLLQEGVTFWLLSSHGSTGQQIYTDDGILALMDFDCWRGFETGQSTSSPDDGDGAVNPVDDLESWNISDVVDGADLHGLITYFDTCQLGLSYGPAIMLEAGAESVVACWVDSYIGPSDLVEWNVLNKMAVGLPISNALVSAFSINSHLYSLDMRGVNYYIASSSFHLVSASSNQFVIFGNPTAGLFDCYSFIPPVLKRTIPYTDESLIATAGQNTEISIGIADIFGNPIPSATISYSIKDPSSSIYQTGTVVCDDDFLADIEIVLPESCEIGDYSLYYERPLDNQTYSLTIQVMLPVPIIDNTNGTIGDWVDIELGLLSHTSDSINVSIFEYEILNEDNVSIVVGSSVCNESYIACVHIQMNHSLDIGMYTIKFNVLGSSHIYQTFINLELPIVLFTSFNVVAGDWIFVELGLKSPAGNIIEAASFNYTIYDPTDTIFAEGVAVCNDTYIAGLNVTFSIYADAGDYIVRFSVPDTSHYYETSIHVDSAPPPTSVTTTTATTTTGITSSDPTTTISPHPLIDTGIIPMAIGILTIGFLIGLIMIWRLKR